MIEGINSAGDLLFAYTKGERHFADCDFDTASLQFTNLSGAKFHRCFMSCDFRGASLVGTSFHECNLKTAIFSEANLTNAKITKCSIECINFKKAIIENLQFENNYYMGEIMNLVDLQSFC